jgi:hypothetical protein
MTLARILILFAVLVGLAATGRPASADQRGRGPSHGGGYRGPVYGGYRGPVYGRYPGHGYRVPPPYFAQPYYRFRPRYSVAGGLWLGFAVPFPRYGYAAFGFGYPFPPYGYGAYPVPYPVPYAVPPPVGYQQATPIYPPAGSTGQVSISPPQVSSGGISLDISPPDAEVWVDGGYAGRAADFGPQRRPLTLAPGVHRIELRAPGFVTSLFDVTVTPGYVLPYQGALQPAP